MSRERPQILVLSPRPANPPNTGAKLREFHLLRQMSGWADLRLLAFRTGEDPLELGFGEVESFLRPKGYTPGKVLRGLVGGQALSILNYRSEEMAGRLVELLQARKWDAILLEALHMAAYEPEWTRYAPGIPCIWDWHNIESELMERYAGVAPTWLHGLYARETARRLRKLEGRILRGKQDVHLVCSAREQERLSQWIPQARIGVVPNGVDCNAFQPTSDVNRSGGLLFVGSLDYHPNVEGLKFLTREVWPEVMRRKPESRLRIVGSRPLPEVLAMGKLSGVEVVGPVERVEPYYEQAAAALVPLFSGGGTRLKVLEAFAAGVAVVSTSLGVEGIEASKGEHYLAAETAAEWVEALLHVDGQAARLARNGRELAERRYDWQVIGAGMQQLVEDWITASR